MTRVSPRTRRWQQSTTHSQHKRAESVCCANTRCVCSKCRFLMIRCHTPHHARIKLLCPECAGDAHLRRDARPWQLCWSPTGGAWRATRDQSRRYRHAGVAGSPGVKGIVLSHDTAICIACSGHGGHFWRLLHKPKTVSHALDCRALAGLCVVCGLGRVLSTPTLIGCDVRPPDGSAAGSGFCSD